MLTACLKLFINPIITSPTAMTLEEELLQDAEYDAQAVEYIRTHLPQELQNLYTEEQLYYFCDLITEFCADKGVFDPNNADADGYVDIDLEAIAQYIAQKAKKEDIGSFDSEQLFFVVQVYLDFDLGLEEE